MPVLPPVTQVSGRGVYVPGDDIDTDRIIPARFMKCVTFDGLGEMFFYDVRFTEDGSKKKHNLNDPRFEGASIIISGNNFGCGSSREHAPQAIARAGFNGIIAEGFAEIFFGNATQLGIPCVKLTESNIQKLIEAVEANPQTEITIDLEKQVVRFGSEEVPCEIRPGARDSLIQGKWDPLADLLEASAEVDKVAASLPYVQQTAS